MKKYLLFISAASLLLAGCAKEQLVKEQHNNGAVTVVEATFETLTGEITTKAAVTDAGVFTWQNGDKAAFAESDASASYCSGENGANGANATFAIDGSHTFTSDSWAVYPYDLASGQTPAALEVTVPASRVWATGQTNVAMYGVKNASAASFNFSHMGGLVRIRVNNVPTNAREFVFKAGGCKINGEFAVNTVSEYKVIETAASDNESEQTYTLTWTSAPDAENTMDFFIPLPVGTYGGGFAFYLKDADHNILYSKVGSTSQTIARKKLLLMPAITLMGGAIEPVEKAAVVQEVPAGHSGDFILENCEKVLLKINTSEQNNDITLKYGGGNLPTTLEIQVVGNKFDKKISGNLPYTHLDYTQGDIANVEITTSASTFNIVHPATVSEKLIVTGGNVVLKGATVKAIEVAEGATADGENPVRIEMEKFTPEGGEEVTPAVTDTIVAKANIVVAPAEGVSVTVKPDGDDVTITPEGEGEVIDDSNSKGGPLPGVFSVSATKKVQFSPGNLYVKKDDSGNWNLNFYDEQYACNSLNSTFTWQTTTNRPISKDDNESDLFSWGYGDWSKSLYSPSFYVKGYDNPDNDCEQFSKTEDWGYAFGGESSVWRTLNVYEWEYLFGNSTERNGKYKCGVTVCGHPNCVVLLPDNWKWEGAVGTEWQENTMGVFEYSEKTTVKWSTMEEAGAVCLPSAGYSTGANVRGVELYGAYWTSSGTSELGCWGELSGEDFDLAHYLWFTNKNISCFDGSERMQGNSVRLVTDVHAK